MTQLTVHSNVSVMKPMDSSMMRFMMMEGASTAGRLIQTVISVTSSISMRMKTPTPEERFQIPVSLKVIGCVMPVTS